MNFQYCLAQHLSEKFLIYLNFHVFVINIKRVLININQDNIKKATYFFEDLKIQNLELYFDTSITLAKKFRLRGIPTSILINKDGLEFARIIGSTNFEDKKFIKWLSNYN